MVDGYFPFEMKDAHPDGVPFKLVDRSDQPHDAGFKAFVGQGVRLDGGAAGPAGRGLHSSTVRLNVSTFCAIRWVHHFPPVY
jgi:hypothetical protein